MRSWVLACVMVLAAASARAELWSAPAGGFTLEFPDGWTAIEMPPAILSSLPPGGLVVTRRTSDSTRAAIVTRIPGVPEPELSDELVAGFDNGLFKDQPARKLSSERVAIEGRPAYRYLASLPNGATMAGVLTVREGVMYHLQAVRADGDPTEDKDLAAFLGSYRLP